MNHYEIERKIKDVNRQIRFYKERLVPNDQSTKDILSNLRYKKRKLQAQYTEAKFEYDCREAELDATREIFKKYNNDIYPSDIGQDWRWGVYDGILLMRIDDKLFSVAIKYPKRK